MSRIWYCRNCGYEVGSRGKCHSCGDRLTHSSLPELVSGDEDDEVGYRLDGWIDADRGRLIEVLNEQEILHRFEDDELVVAAEDEQRVDDLVAEVAAAPAGVGAGGGAGAEAGEDPSAQTAAATATEATPAAVAGDPATETALRLLYRACEQLRQDPTDMSAEVDAAEASTAVFMAEFYPGLDDETWAAVGRVTRRLLGALSADEALEDEIRSQASVLMRLLAPLVDDVAPAPAPEPSLVDVDAVEVVSTETDASADWTPAEAAGDEADEPSSESAGETVYELPEWLPEERAQLDVLLDEAAISFEWDGDDLIVPSDREVQVERLFEQVRVAAGIDDDGETRYHAIEELFAAAGRLVSDPADEQRQAEASARVADVIGPPPFGFDEVQWLRIMKLSRALVEQIDAGADTVDIHDNATELRDLLRSVV